MCGLQSSGRGLCVGVGISGCNHSVEVLFNELEGSSTGSVISISHSPHAKGSVQQGIWWEVILNHFAYSFLSGFDFFGWFSIIGFVTSAFENEFFAKPICILWNRNVGLICQIFQVKGTHSSYLSNLALLFVGWSMQFRRIFAGTFIVIEIFRTVN